MTIKEGSIRAKVDRLWGKVEEVKHRRAGKGKGGGKGKGTMERDKVELLLDNWWTSTPAPTVFSSATILGLDAKMGAPSCPWSMRRPSTLGSWLCQGVRTLSPYQRQC